jgi:hypothetical protein
MTEICEWKDCNRVATVMREWGDVYLCHGHSLLAEANYDTYGDYGISTEEYNLRLDQVNEWLANNPNPEGAS